MDKSQKNASFDSIKKFIHRIDIYSGAFVFKDPSSNFTKKEKFLSYTTKIQVFITIILMISTLYVKKEDLISCILSASLFIVIIVLPIQMKKITLNKKEVKVLFKWCEGLYDIEKKFKLVLTHNIVHKKLKKVQKYTEKVVEWFENVIKLDAVLISSYGPFAAIFLRNIVPKFSTALPFYLPFEDQENWVSFTLNVFMQAMFAIYSAATAIFIYNIFFCIVSHIIGYMDIIQEIVETVFKKQIVAKVKDLNDVKSKGTLKIETLMEINDSIEATNNNDKLEFSEWIKILCDMITDVNSQINSLKSFHAEFFLISETQSLGSLFIFGFIVTVVKQQYVLLVCVTVNILLFIICYVNEIILQKLENIERGFYDIPWYYLSVKEQKMLLIALNCSRIQDGFTAAGIHKLTLERFYAVTKAGYTNFIALKDLVG